MAQRKWLSKWVSSNPVLADGELGYEINTGRIKRGDGAKTWTQLPYEAGPSITLGQYEDLIASLPTGGGGATTSAAALTSGVLDPARIADGSLAQAKLTTAVQTLLTKAGSAAQPADVSAAVNALINSAPGTLDTLGEIAAALQADESGAAALTATVSGKLAKSANLSDLVSAATARTNLGLGTAATQPATAFADAAATTAALATKASTASVTTSLALKADADVAVTSADIDFFVKLTQAAYDALPTKDDRTFYMIVG